MWGAMGSESGPKSGSGFTTHVFLDKAPTLSEPSVSSFMQQQ